MENICNQEIKRVFAHALLVPGEVCRDGCKLLGLPLFRRTGKGFHINSILTTLSKTVGICGTVLLYFVRPVGSPKHAEMCGLRGRMTKLLIPQCAVNVVPPAIVLTYSTRWNILHIGKRCTFLLNINTGILCSNRA